MLRALVICTVGSGEKELYFRAKEQWLWPTYTITCEALTVGESGKHNRLFEEWGGVQLLNQQEGKGSKQRGWRLPVSMKAWSMKMGHSSLPALSGALPCGLDISYALSSFLFLIAQAPDPSLFFIQASCYRLSSPGMDGIHCLQTVLQSSCLPLCCSAERSSSRTASFICQAPSVASH